MSEKAATGQTRVFTPSAHIKLGRRNEGEHEMESTLRRILGMYFVVSSLQYVPAAAMVYGIQNTIGPQWLLSLIPLTQGALTAAAGVWLLRAGPHVEDATSVIAPPVETFVQLFGVYFIVNGLVALANPLSGVLFFHEVWSLSAGSRVASAIASVSIGLYLVARPTAIGSFLRKQIAA